MVVTGGVGGVFTFFFLEHVHTRFVVYTPFHSLHNAHTHINPLFQSRKQPLESMTDKRREQDGEFCVYRSGNGIDSIVVK